MPAERCLADVPPGPRPWRLRMKRLTGRSRGRKPGAIAREKRKDVRDRRDFNRCRSCSVATFAGCVRGGGREEWRRSEIPGRSSDRWRWSRPRTWIEHFRSQDRAAVKKAAAQAAALAAQKGSHGSLQAVWEDGVEASATRIWPRSAGPCRRPASTRGFPLVPATQGETRSRGRMTPGGSSGRRLALARWSTDVSIRFSPASGQSHRQHHFGVGIVATPNNFGLKGGAAIASGATRRLAVDLVEHGLEAQTSTPPDHDVGGLSPASSEVYGRE